MINCNNYKFFKFKYFLDGVVIEERLKEIYNLKNIIISIHFVRFIKKNKGDFVGKEMKGNDCIITINCFNSELWIIPIIFENIIKKIEENLPRWAEKKIRFHF